jgi:hypothetical protein
MSYRLLSLVGLLSTQLFCLNSFALVDYSESVASSPRKTFRSTRPKKTIKQSFAKVDTGPSLKLRFNTELKTGIETVELKDDGSNAKVNLYKLDAHFQSNFNMFLDANYWYAASKDKGIAEEVKEQKGNPRFALGFNWLRFGKPAEAAVLDIIAGVSLKETASAFATSRNDKFLGVETSKRFYNFAIGLGAEYHIVGNPDNHSEMSIGDIRKYYATMGWIATPDIAFQVDGVSYTINESTDFDRASYLKEELTFSYLEPKLMLKLSPHVGLEMGGLFRLESPKSDQDLLEARLWNLSGAYGNSMFFKLNIVM